MAGRNRVFFAGLIALAIIAGYLALSKTHRASTAAHSPKQEPAAEEAAVHTQPNDKGSQSPAPQANTGRPTQSNASVPRTTASTATGDLFSNPDWRVSRDGAKLVFASGGKIALEPGGVAAFLKMHAFDLFGVDARELSQVGVLAGDPEKITFNQLIDGKRIYSASLSIYVKDGNIVQVQNDLVPDEQIKTRLLSQYDVASVCETKGWSCKAQSEQLWFASQKRLVPAYFVSPENPTGKAEPFVYLVSANDGAVIKRIRNVIER